MTVSTLEVLDQIARKPLPVSASLWFLVMGVEKLFQLSASRVL